MTIRRVVSAILVLGSWALVGGCSGKTDTGSTGSGAHRDDGGPDAGLECMNGATKPAGDGCNTCSCNGGQWACTEKACTTPVCNAGDSQPAGDGCNTCSCLNGQWACTTIACPPTDCVPGQVRDQGFCNQCTCSSSGQWDCTNIACDSDAPQSCGGILGQTCGAGQYCAYKDGELCGAADATAFCLPIPKSCPKDLHEVCGCDGATYSNACFAAMAGTGVMSSETTCGTRD